MLIGELTRDTKINIFYDTPEGTEVYSTTVIERGNTNFELVVRAIITEDNKIAKFNSTYPIRIELEGNSCVGLKLDSIDFSYNGGVITHILKSRNRFAIPNKRDTFRIPFHHNCIFHSVHKLGCKAHIRDISFEGISIIVNNVDITKVVPNSIISIEFSWGLNCVSFELRCRVARIQPLEDGRSILGCTIQTGQNTMRTLIMHLQMEEVKRRRNTYTLKQ